MSIAIAGLAIQVWLTTVPTGEMVSAHDNLLTTADWMVKASIGALLGFAGGAKLASRSE